MFVVFVLAAIYLNLQPLQGITVQDSVRSVILQDGMITPQQKSMKYAILESMGEVLSIRDQQRKRQISENFGSCSEDEFTIFFSELL